jgi:hypothetical protein
VDVIPSFEVNSRVTLIVSTGFSGGRGWTINGYAPGDRSDVTITNPIKELADNQRNQLITITIGANWYSATSTNEYQFVLTNNLFEAGFTSAFIVDDILKCPSIRDIQATNNGDSYTYTIYLNQTSAPLSHVVVWAWYAYSGTTMPAIDDTESWIKYAERVEISGNTAMVTIVPKNQDGTIIFKCLVYDTENRASTQYLKQFIVEGGETTPGGGALDQPFMWTNAVFAVLIVGILISVVIAAPRFMAGRLESGAIVITIGIAISAVLAFIIGITPSLAFLLG